MTHNKVGSFKASLSAIIFLAACSQVNAAEITISKDAPKQGQTIEVKIKGTFDAPPAVSFHKSTYQTFKLEPEAAVTGTASDTAVEPIYQTLIGIPADLKPGSYKLKIGSDERSIKVVDGKFPVQRLSLPKKVTSLEPAPGEMEAVQKCKEALSSQRLWHDIFQVPSPARVSTQFGLKRIVNGKLLDDYFHSGIDYAGGLGSPVKATAPGTVILARSGFKLHGNVICVDHGQGVVSFYLHLSKMLVKEGDKVKQGEVIGKIGQTGRANGPHLHFSLYVNQVATNPVDWYKQVY